jgi:hypothetical protein
MPRKYFSYLTKDIKKIDQPSKEDKDIILEKPTYVITDDSYRNIQHILETGKMVSMEGKSKEEMLKMFGKM